MKQEKRPPRILYWKWDDSHIDSGSYRAGIDDLCERSCFDTVFICTHWCRDGLSTKKTHDAVLDASANAMELFKRGSTITSSAPFSCAFCMACSWLGLIASA